MIRAPITHAATWSVMRSGLRLTLLRVTAHVLALVVRLWAKSCRIQIEHDPRPALRRLGRPYVYALLHGQQIAAVLANDEAQMAAMVSRSTDGDLLVPSLRARGVHAARGSSAKGRQDKGGARALAQLIALNRQGLPVLLAVDGPRGPRGVVQRGVVALAQATGAVILPVSVRASRAWVLRKTWDHTEVPWPGSVLRLRFGTGVDVGADASASEIRRNVALQFEALGQERD